MSTQYPLSTPNPQDQQEEVSVQAPTATATTRQTRRSRKSEGAFRTISEVAKLLDVQQHVLRFWETKFSQIRPLKRGGGRRYYRPEDVELLTTIHHLLYTEGYTIKGVQKLLREQGKNNVVQNNKPDSATAEAPKASQSAPAQTSQPKTGLSVQGKSIPEQTLDELKELRKLVSSE